MVCAEHLASIATALPSHRTSGLNVRVGGSPDHRSPNQAVVRGRVKGSFIDRVAVAVPAKLSVHQHDTHKGPKRYAAPRSKSIDEYFKRRNCSE